MSAASKQYEAEQSRAMIMIPPDTVEPRNMTELMSLAGAAAKSGFFGAKSPEQALLICMSGRDLGLSYAQALRAFHVIEGRPTLSADGMVAVCLIRRDVCEYFRTIECTNDRAAVETKRTGSPAQSYVFSMDDAKRAGVVGKQNWAKYPSRMLLARARAALARDVYPDLLLGLYDPDEIGESPIVMHTEPARANVTVVPVPGPSSEPRSDDLAKVVAEMTEEFAVAGRDGTMADQRRLVAKAARLSTEAKLALSQIARASKAAILEREKNAKRAPTLAPEREPGDDAEEDADAAEAYFQGRDNGGVP